MPSQPLPARTPSAPLGNAPRGPRRGGPKKRRTKRQSRAAYVVAAFTVLLLAGATAWFSAYMWERWFPPAVPGSRAGEAARLTVQMAYDSETPARKGLVVMAPDQIYRKTALDLAGIARRESVERLCAKGVLTVFGDGAFHGAEPVTRAEYVTWLYNAWLAQTARGDDPFMPVKNAPTVVSGTPDMFDDVGPDHWAFEVLATLKGNRLLSDRVCRPDAVVRREEWATLSRMVLQPVAARENEKGPQAQQLAGVMMGFSFNDAGAIAPEHAPAVYWVLRQAKYATAVTQTFDIPIKAGPWKPNAALTRMEAAVWIDEVFEDIGQVN